MKLHRPHIDQIPDYISVLRRGWSPDNLRPDAAQEQIKNIESNAASFVSSLDDPNAEAGLVTLPDGSKVPRLPSIQRWIWDERFCGHISLRWQPETEELPPTCSGHIGYAVVPWRQGEGLATAALVEILPDAKKAGLSYVEITASPDNAASLRVIEKAGGVWVSTFVADKSLGGHETSKFKIILSS